MADNSDRKNDSIPEEEVLVLLGSKVLIILWNKIIKSVTKMFETQPVYPSLEDIVNIKKSVCIL